MFASFATVDGQVWAEYYERSIEDAHCFAQQTAASPALNANKFASPANIGLTGQAKSRPRAAFSSPEL
jgi:hypothetical protein